MTTTIQVRVDKEIKKKADKTFKNMGLDMSSGVKLFLHQVVRSGSIPFPLMSADYLPRKEKLALIRETKIALREGKSYASLKEMYRDILEK
ncbi:MAG: type II toxin-antitoxin system RelB/DinJ family antitoxin [bacterium]|nr:type II toxin-antitoxin system RelB/DinJ family antitoxin [bacterium]